MNPIIHGGISWLVGQPLRARRDRILVTCAGLAPDVDGLTLLGGLELYSAYHHKLFHGYVGALVTAAVCVLLARQRLMVGALALVAFHVHLVCDLAGSGPGWPIWYAWPTSMTEWYWDGQWNLASWQNTTIGFGVIIACLATAFPWRRTFVEVFSSRADAQVVATLRRRFLGEVMPSDVTKHDAAHVSRDADVPSRDSPASRS